MGVLKKTFSLFSILFFSSSLTAQTDTIFDGHVISSDWVDQGISAGFNYGNYMFGEAGYYRSYVWEAGGFPTLSSTMNYGLEFSHIDNLILAPKVQGRIHAYFFNGSLSALCYADFNLGYAIKLRPEIGIGLWNLDINYGYNIGIYNDNFDLTNKHMISIKYYIKLYRKILNEFDSNGNIRP
jgi:hypothetical protein